MNERYPETPGVNRTPRTPRDYPPRPMPFSNPLCPSGVSFASNMSASRYPSTASTSGNLSNSSYPASSSPYLPVLPYPVCTSSYSSSTNSTYPRCVSPYLASSNSRYPVSSSSYHHVSSNNPYSATGSPYADISNRHYAANCNSPYPISTLVYPDSSNRHYAASFNSPYPIPTLVYPDSSNRHYAASFNSPYPTPTLVYPDSSNRHYAASFNSPYPIPTLVYPGSSNRHYAASFNRPYPIFTSVYPDRHYPAPSSMNQLPSSFPYPSMGSRGYTSQFGPSVDQINDDACYINSLPNEIILKIFSYLTQNQLGQIARVCKKWSMLTKSPVLWKKVDVEIFCSSDEERDAQSFKSFINGLPSCVTFIRLDLSGGAAYYHYLDFEKLCMKLHHCCPNVQVLILAHCDISTFLPEVINVCTQFLQDLKKIVFRYCYLDKSGTAKLKDNSNVEVLDLYGSHFSLSRKIQFSKLRSLKELRLARTNVGDSWFVGDTSFLNHLQVLDLGWTYVTASTFLTIQRQAQNMKELYLCRSDLEDHDFSFHNLEFPQLQTICLWDTIGLTCDGLASLVRSCPSLVSVYVKEGVARSFAEHPFVVTNRCKSGIVKSVDLLHDHDVDYSHN